MLRFFGRKYNKINNRSYWNIYNALSDETEASNKVIKVVGAQLSTLSPKKRRSFLKSMIKTYALRKSDNNLMCCFLDITYQCNLSCAHCINKDSVEKPIEMDINSFRDVMKKIKETVSVVMISGGEPMLRKDIIIELKNHRDMLFLIFTNGTAINNEYLHEIRNIDNIAFLVSIDGFAEQHDTRKGKNTYEKATNAVKLIRSYGFLCGVVCVVNNDTYTIIKSENFIRNIKELGGNFILYLCEQNSTSQNFDIYNTFSKNEINSNILPVLNLPYDEIMFPFDGCVAGKVLFHIAVDGRLSHCPFIKEDLGNIFSMTMSDAINSLKSNKSYCPYNKQRTNSNQPESILH